MYIFFLKGDFVLSYRDDLNAFAKQRSKLIKTVILAVKITVVVLALALVATTVTVIVDVASSMGSSGHGGSSGGGGGKDSKAPTIYLTSGNDDIIYIVINDGDSDNVKWRSLVKATDNGVEVAVNFDNTKVDTKKVGEYKLYCTATDSAGNTAKKEFSVVVTEAAYSREAVMNLVASMVEKAGIMDTMTTEEKVRAIYNFVNSPEKDAKNATIKYGETSLTTNIDRSDWKTGWLTEAKLALDQIKNNGKTTGGDCYTYYSVSKAFFEYYGIQHEGIMRNDKSTLSGTHFWLIVNIGDQVNQRWYYFDPTRLNGKYSLLNDNNGCLLTYDELMSYVTSNGEKDFYTFDEKAYQMVSNVSLY